MKHNCQLRCLAKQSHSISPFLSQVSVFDLSLHSYRRRMYSSSQFVIDGKGTGAPGVGSLDAYRRQVSNGYYLLQQGLSGIVMEHQPPRKVQAEWQRTRAFHVESEINNTVVGIESVRRKRKVSMGHLRAEALQKKADRISYAERKVAHLEHDMVAMHARQEAQIAEKDDDLAKLMEEIALEEQLLETQKQQSAGKPASMKRRTKNRRPLAPDESQLARNVTGALGGRMSEVIVSAFKVNMTRQLLSCLVGANWLNDEVVNFYRELMAERELKRMETTGTPREVWFANSFFFAKLLSQQEGYQYKNVRRWTKRAKVDIFSLRTMIIPVNIANSHWVLAVINFIEKTLTYYDSMGSGGVTVLDALHRYIQDEHENKKKSPLPNLGEWRKVSPGRAVPQQGNCSDCGVFMSQFANYIAEQSELDFSQADMPYFRNRMAVEIARKQLL